MTWNAPKIAALLKMPQPVHVANLPAPQMPVRPVQAVGQARPPMPKFAQPKVPGTYRG